MNEGMNEYQDSVGRGFGIVHGSPEEAGKAIELLLHNVRGEPGGERVLGGWHVPAAAAVRNVSAPRAERQALLLPGDHVGDPDVPAADVGHEVGVGGAGDGVEPRAAAAGLDLVGEEGRGALLLLLSGAAAATATAYGDSVVDATKEGICSREHEPVQMRGNDDN